MQIPKYIAIKNDLKNKINSGMFTSGDKFYSESRLQKIYNVSSITVIHALKDLVKEGYLVRHQGKGTFISRARVNRLVKFTDKEAFSPNDECVKVLNITLANDKKILKTMGLDLDQKYYLITRIRYADDIPYMFQNSYIPARFITKPQDLDYYKSIYSRFRSEFKINLNESPSIEINKIVFPAPEKITSALGLNKNEPAVFQSKKTHLNFSKELVEYVTSYKRWDYYKIEISSEEN